MSMNKLKKKLKQCPMCGGIAKPIKATRLSDGKSTYKIYCTRCNLRTCDHRLKWRAVEHWNNRE